MTRTFALSFAAAALLAAGAADAATTTTTKTTKTTKPAASGRMVTTKTRTGKTVTYDCAKPGNATKAACKK